MSRDDVAELRRRLANIGRLATSLHRHVADLHSLAWDPDDNRDPLEERSGSGGEDRSPRAGDPAARRLLAALTTEALRIEATLVGLERDLYARFRPGERETMRGFRVAGAEFDDALAAQERRRERGEYTPARLEQQPRHAGER